MDSYFPLQKEVFGKTEMYDKNKATDINKASVLHTEDSKNQW